ncbi:MAG TPA: YdcF family protein [Ignavibacteriaceae bacterium]
MMAKNKKRERKFLPVFIILAITADLAFLYFNKYNNQNLTLRDFDLFYFGNIINLLFVLLLIIGLLVIIFKKSIVFNLKIFIPVFLINQFILVTLYFLKYMPLPFKKLYYLGQTGDELFIGAIFFLYTLTFLILIFIVWLSIFKFKKIILFRAFINSILSMIVILLLVFLFIIGKESTIKESLLKINKNTVGVVLGAAVWSDNRPSPSLAGRVDKALELYQQKIISQIFLTGSNAPGELSESEVALNYIKSKGIKTSDIFLEKATTSTNEQIQYIKKKLVATANKNIIVISDSYHLVRVLEIAKFNKLNIQVSASKLSQSFDKTIYNNTREALALTMFWLYAL